MTAPVAPTSGFLPDRAVAALRARAERGMTARAEAMRPTRVRVAPGKYEVQPATVPGLAAVPCAFRPATTPGEAVRADAVQALSELEVDFPAGTPVDASMTLTIRHLVPGFVSPLTVAVTGVEVTSGPEIVRRVYGTRIAETAP